MKLTDILALIAKLFGAYSSIATGGAATAVNKVAPTVNTVVAVGTILTTPAPKA